MAVTYSGLVNTVIGDKRLVVFNLTATAAEEEVGSSYHGCGVIDAVLGMTRVSGTTNCGTAVIGQNMDSTGVASAGCLGFSSLVGAASNVMRVAFIGH